MRLFSLFALIFLISCSCSKDEIVEPTYSKMDLMLKIVKEDPNAREILPKDMNSGIKCTDYGPGCVRGYVGRILGYDVIFVEFETPALAKNEALRVNQLYSRNWILDDSKGEPPLEKFFKKVLDAKDPTSKIVEGEIKTSP